MLTWRFRRMENYLASPSAVRGGGRAVSPAARPSRRDGSTGPICLPPRRRPWSTAPGRVPPSAAGASHSPRCLLVESSHFPPPSPPPLAGSLPRSSGGRDPRACRRIWGEPRTSPDSVSAGGAWALGGPARPRGLPFAKQTSPRTSPERSLPHMLPHSLRCQERRLRLTGRPMHVWCSSGRAHVCSWFADGSPLVAHRLARTQEVEVRLRRPQHRPCWSVKLAQAPAAAVVSRSSHCPPAASRSCVPAARRHKNCDACSEFNKEKLQGQRSTLQWRRPPSLLGRLPLLLREFSSKVEKLS